MLRVLISVFLLLVPSFWAKLTAQPDGFYYNGQKVFLSGANIAWYSYGYDFGNNQYDSHGPQLESWLTEISNNGGNSVRIWLHVEGENTPKWDSNGYVTAPDASGTLFSDMKRFLNFAQSKNILVIFTLWNGAEMHNQKVIDLVWDDSKLESYIDNVLRPMASELRGHPALGAWEIVNEMEGSVRVPDSRSERCFDTGILDGSGAGWTFKSIQMERFLRFYNLQLAVLKTTDPTALVTGGSWSEKSQNSVFSGSFNYYSDECLTKAGGNPTGTLDFFQMHSYAWQSQWNPSGPFKHPASSYNLGKPIVIGEFASSCSEGESIEQLMEHAYSNGYSGIWTWTYSVHGGGCEDDRATQHRGFNHLRGRTDNGVVNFQVG
ncbi:mannan endo-1,4-beta-mannosidase-like [Artemia franciscana]|uniref:Mannan endo-1,4-beta-mannosidase n=1 Tax=Artemia franciscana TaxID=6661 RepID=A0AA88I9E1_ARTSF|nr:hypothetical protein QYM36_002245 [Artemia franciscana]